MIRLPPFAALLLVAAGCGGDDGNHFPVNPGGGGSGSSTLPDAGTDAGEGTTIAGRACLLGDPRALTTCASTGADGLTVTLGDKTALTTVDGSFVIDRPTGTGLVWRVSGTGVESSAMPQATSKNIPVISSLLYGDMLASTNAIVAAGDGAIIMRVATAGTGVAGVIATPSPQPDSLVYYDGASATDWRFDSTGAFGIVWVPSILAGTASVALAHGSAQSTVVNIAVYANTISFAFAAAP